MSLEPDQDADAVERDAELPLDRIRQLLDLVGRAGLADEAWELGIHVETLSEALKERDLRLQAYAEESSRYQERLERGHEEYSQLRESMNELLDLNELSEAISTSFKLQNIFDALMDLSRRYVDYESCGVFGLTAEDGRFEPLALRGDGRLLGRQVEAYREDGIVDWILREGRPVIIDDMEMPGTDPAAGRSWVVVPLRVRGKAIGIYTLYSRKAKADFTSGEIELLGVLASQTAVAIDNAQLYTDLEGAHKSLKESQRQLLLSDKLAAVGELAGGVAHEVNNPLQIILSRVQLMRMQYGDDERLLGGLELVENNVKRISKIIRALLGFARHSATSGEWGSVDLRQSLNQACALVRHQLEGQLIELQLDCPEDLPALTGSAGELEQVFINLLLNAQNAMSDGGALRVRARLVGDTVELRFADTGVGIEAEHLDRIFEPFFTTRSDEGGTGLGLAVSYGIIEVHGGVMTVESEPGSGTTFIIRLPLAGAPAADKKQK